MAAALARLGAGRELLDRDDLPAGTVVSAIAAPYGPFRDDSAEHLPLDYELLTAGLARDDLAPLLAHEFRPGHGECTIDATDLPGVTAGLDSPHAIVRRHAVAVLGEAIGLAGEIDIDARARAAGRDRIREIAANDADASVRRIAGLALAY